MSKRRPQYFGNSAVRRAYFGSDADQTLALMNRLLEHDDGQLAVLLFRAQKASTRAKAYHGKNENGERYSSLAYDRKAQALETLVRFLETTGGEAWGWKVDHRAEHAHRFVLYVDTYVGQCSFHSRQRFGEKNYDGRWDPSKPSEETILEFCEMVERECRIALEKWRNR